MRVAARVRAGVTLLELLLVAALLTLLLALAAALTPTLRQLESSANEALLRLQRQRAAVEALRFELRQAGYGDAVPTLRIEPQRSGGDRAGQALVFAYLVDRWRAAPTRRAVRLAAGRDGRGSWSLYRAEGAAPRQPVVAEVVALRLVAVATAAGWRSPPPPGGTVAGALALGIEIEFSWGTTLRVAVALPTPQALTVAG